MKKLSELQSERADKYKILEQLATDSESRELTVDEKTRFDALEAEIASLDGDIKRAESAESIRKNRALDKVKTKTPEATVMEKFSFHKAVKQIANKGKLDGAELEMWQEANSELEKSGGVTGQVAVPSFGLNVIGKNVMGQPQRRDLSSGGSTTGDELVEDMPVGHIFGLNIMPKVIQLGATVLRGLTSDVHFTKTGVAAAVWETENSAADETTPSTARVTLTPNRLAAFTDLSRTLVTQTGPFVEQFIRRELETAVNVKLDSGAINGSGSGEPTGILNFGTGVNTVAMGTDGAAPTRAKFIEMWQLIAEDNADLDSMALLTSPGIKSKSMTTNLDAGSGRFIWENDTIIGLGVPCFTSNNIPTNLTKGSGTSLHAAIMAVWSQLLIGNWGGMDIIVDPFSRSKENLITLVVNTNWDIKARHLQAFAHIKDLVAV